MAKQKSEILQAERLAEKALKVPLPQVAKGLPRSLLSYVQPEKGKPDRALDQNVLTRQIKRLKSTPNQSYGDEFNSLVCQQLDSSLATGQIDPRRDDNLLKAAEKTITDNLFNTISSNDRREEFLLRILAEATYAAINYNKRRNLRLDEDKAVSLAVLWALTKLTQPYPLEREDQVRLDLLNLYCSSLFKGEVLNICSLVCASFIHQRQSEPGTVTINTAPLVETPGRDNDDVIALNNLSQTSTLIQTFLGIELVRTTAILSDVDLVEVFKSNNPDVLRDLDSYFEQYQDVCQNLGLIPLSFLGLLNSSPALTSDFRLSMADIRNNIESSQRNFWLADPRNYVNPRFLSEMAESIYQYYNDLPGVSMRREVARQNTIDKLAVYGSQPTTLKQLFPNGFIFCSSEVPVRDWMYFIRYKGQKRPFNIIYPFQLDRFWD